MAPGPSSAPFDHFNARLELLCREWDLGLEPKIDYSPSKSGKTLQDVCVSGIRFLHHKQKINDSLERFRAEATILYNGWVYKPKAERGLVPESTRDKPRPVTSGEREQLLKCLAKILKEDRENWMKENGKPLPRTVNDKPVPFPLSPRASNSDPKRARPNEVFSDLPNLKKPRKPTPQSKSFDIMPPPDRGRSMIQASRSANTSFASNTSSVFSRDPSTFPNTQETVPDDEPSLRTQEIRESFTTPQDRKSSDYASSSFEARVADVPECDFINAEEVKALHQADIYVSEEFSQEFLDFGISNGESGQSDEEEFLKKLQEVFRTSYTSKKNFIFILPLTSINSSNTSITRNSFVGGHLRNYAGVPTR